MSSKKIEAIVVLFLLTSGIITLAAASPGPAAAPELKRGIGYAFLGAAFIMVIILLVMLIKRKIRDWSHDCFWTIYKFNDLTHVYTIIYE
jgi:hypothetical protein